MLFLGYPSLWNEIHVYYTSNLYTSREFKEGFSPIYAWGDAGGMSRFVLELPVQT